MIAQSRCFGQVQKGGTTQSVPCGTICARHTERGTQRDDHRTPTSHRTNSCGSPAWAWAADVGCLGCDVPPQPPQRLLAAAPCCWAGRLPFLHLGSGDDLCRRHAVDHDCACHVACLPCWRANRRARPAQPNADPCPERNLHRDAAANPDPDRHTAYPNHRQRAIYQHHRDARSDADSNCLARHPDGTP